MRKTTLCLAFTLAVGVACNEHPLKEVSVRRESQDDLVVDVNPNRNVDILFVLDNSGSMAEEQGTLARNFEAFVAVLEAEDVDANYRIAVTTTENFNPLCGHSVPEQGKFVMSSCRSRLEEFDTRTFDAREVACTSACPAAWDAFETLPTVLGTGDRSLARPWMERVDGRTNLPEGLTTSQAFACFGPQGIAGCGYEAPLESMYLALSRAMTTDEPEYGFLRRDALLAIVFVTDEVDCSISPEGAKVFASDGDRSLWPNPTDGAPSNALCWSAGVACEESELGERYCEPVDVGPDALLHPVSRYTDFLDTLIEQKREVRPDAAVFVSVISGVPTTYRGGDLLYPVRDGGEFDLDFGSPPGCSSDNGVAVPPVRLRAFAEYFGRQDEQAVFSVCNESYVDALESIAHALEARFVPACLEQCPADRDETTPEYQPHCQIHERMPDGEKIPVPWCEGNPDAPALPQGADVCVALAIGEARHPACIERDLPAEFKVLRRPGAPRVPGATIEASCALSDSPDVDCGA